jgi:hypothetical protein
MTIYLPNPVLHETGAEIDEFVDVLLPDPPPPPAPSRALTRGSPTDLDAGATGRTSSPTHCSEPSNAPAP